MPKQEKKVYRKNFALSTAINIYNLAVPILKNLGSTSTKGEMKIPPPTQETPYIYYVRGFFKNKVLATTYFPTSYLAVSSAMEVLT
ncbi:hypothetical protein, partial [Desulfovibrio gilichinskyi]|uniref:hypothetical protein n=1 Tax=Desulfovibrio gilichinskyi TaxID=1519643 RepID=UPI001BB0010E